jgi:hypothetical protein
MPYKVICYSHKPVQSWGPYNDRQDAIDKVNSHPGHDIDYYTVASLGAVKASALKFFRNNSLWNPPILKDFDKGE